MQDNNNQDQDIIEQIRISLIKELGIEEADREIQDEVLDKMGEVIMEKVFLEVMKRLDDAGRETFQEMLDKKKPESEVEEFIKTKIPGIESVIREIVVELKKKMIEAGKMEI